MTRILRKLCSLKFLAFNATLAALCLAVASAEAQVKPSQVKNKARIIPATKINPLVVKPSPFKKHDLQVSGIQGTLSGGRYYLACNITNIGVGEYPGNRVLKVIGVSPDKKRTVLITTVFIDRIRPGGTYRASVNIAASQAPSNHFVLILSDAGPRNDQDANTQNDWQQIVVSEAIR